MLNVLLKLKNKKGFTMIEMIVVLVIIAILAAAAIPTMIGYVNRARESGLISEARIGFVAAQSVATERKAMATSTSVNYSGINTDPRFKTLIDPLIYSKFSEPTVGTDGTVTHIEYTGVVGGANKTVKIDSANGTTVE